MFEKVKDRIDVIMKNKGKKYSKNLPLGKCLKNPDSAIKGCSNHLLNANIIDKEKNAAIRMERSLRTLGWVFPFIIPSLRETLSSCNRPSASGISLFKNSTSSLLSSCTKITPWVWPSLDGTP